jgi:hypothetical protein
MHMAVACALAIKQKIRGMICIEAAKTKMTRSYCRCANCGARERCHWLMADNFRVFLWSDSGESLVGMRLRTTSAATCWGEEVRGHIGVAGADGTAASIGR